MRRQQAERVSSPRLTSYAKNIKASGRVTARTPCPGPVKKNPKPIGNMTGKTCPRHLCSTAVRAATQKVRPIPLNFNGRDSMSTKFESSNLNEDNVSREVGRTCCRKHSSKSKSRVARGNSPIRAPSRAMCIGEETHDWIMGRSAMYKDISLPRARSAT